MEAVKIHQPCPDCGSSDALTINDDGSTKCHSCGKFTPHRYGSADREQKVAANLKRTMLSPCCPVSDLTARKIKRETLNRFG